MTPDADKLRAEISRLESIETYHREQSVWHHRNADHAADKIHELRNTLATGRLTPRRWWHRLLDLG